jgi:hypothetical protein
MYQEEDVLVLNEKYDFELADLGDLSQYTFNELSNLLKNFDCSLHNHSTFFFAKFESNYSILEVQYLNSGKFVKIVDQYWK